jgi:hypothetical protein
MKADPTAARLLDQMAEEREDWLKLTSSLTDKLGERDARIAELERRLAIAKDYLDSDWFPHKSKGGITRSIARKALS